MPKNSVVGAVVIVTVVVIIVIAAVVAVIVVVAVAHDNGTILIKQNYPKEEEGEPRYFATRIVGYIVPSTENGQPQRVIDVKKNISPRLNSRITRLTG